MAEPVPTLLNWLSDENGAIFRIIGKAVIFKAVFEYAFAQRFSGEGWVEPETMFRSIVSESAADPESEAAKIAPSAFECFAPYPNVKSCGRKSENRGQVLCSNI